MSAYLETSELLELFNDFKTTAFRAELLPFYDIVEERESFERWKAGGAITEAETDTGWQMALRSYAATGRTVQRVRVVNGALTDYQLNAFDWWYPHNSTAGEDIRIVDVATMPVELPPQDFWLFDSSAVVLVDYDDSNALVGFRTLDGDVSPYLYWRDQLVAASVPWQEFSPIKGSTNGRQH